MTAPAYTFISLGLDETPANRSFADPFHTTQDAAALNNMRDSLAALIASPAAFASRESPAIFFHPEPDQRYHRIILCDLMALGSVGEFAVVGFFGQQRPGADAGPISDLDTQLIAEFSRYPEIVSYSSMELGPGGDYGNLVILTQDRAREHWRESKIHQFAVRELSPAYYASIRLHSGLLRGGLAGGAITLARTKYFDFRDGLWCGLRLYS